MLRNSFQHIPGIGPRSEFRLWNLGFKTWASVVHHRGCELPGRYASIGRHVDESIVELDRGNASFFYDRMPPDQHWRLFPEFRHSVAYLDIESSGGRWGADHITTIALYDGDAIHYYVRERNLADFKYDIQKYKLLVTYNGKCFDVPFIERTFDIKLDAAHIDLMYVLRSLGYRGGLKGCEKQLGIDRGDLDGVDGYFAVLLWDEFARNRNEAALETLLAYNIEDVVNLEALMIQAYNMKIKRTPFLHSHQFEMPTTPVNPFKADLGTIRKIREMYYVR